MVSNIHNNVRLIHPKSLIDTHDIVDESNEDHEQDD